MRIKFLWRKQVIIRGEFKVLQREIRYPHRKLISVHCIRVVEVCVFNQAAYVFTASYFIPRCMRKFRE